MKPLLLSLLVCSFACNDTGVSRAVGASCSRSSECDERCLTGHWPGGFCSISCDVDADCPVDTVCIKEDTGVCAFTCATDPDCDFLDAAYVCKNVDSQQGGKVDICRGQ